MTKLYDISMTISPQMPVYKNRVGKKPRLEVVSDHDRDGMRESVIHMNLHTGTHIDAPLHMIPRGTTIENYDLTNTLVPCTVLDMTNATDCITEEDLNRSSLRTESFVLLKTRNSYQAEFDFEFVYLDVTGAGFLVDMGIAGIGIDALGIERSQPAHETHRLLLGNGIPVIEGLRLKEVPPLVHFAGSATANRRGGSIAREGGFD